MCVCVYIYSYLLVDFCIVCRQRRVHRPGGKGLIKDGKDESESRKRLVGWVGA